MKTPPTLDVGSSGGSTQVEPCDLLTVTTVTIPQAAAALRCRTRKVFELLATGVLQRAQRYGRQTVITAESVQAALEAQCRQPQCKPRRQRTRRSAAEEAAMLLAERRAARRTQST